MLKLLDRAKDVLLAPNNDAEKYANTQEDWDKLEEVRKANNEAMRRRRDGAMAVHAAIDAGVVHNSLVQEGRDTGEVPAVIATEVGDATENNKGEK